MNKPNTTYSSSLQHVLLLCECQRFSATEWAAPEHYLATAKNARTLLIAALLPLANKKLHNFKLSAAQLQWEMLFGWKEGSYLLVSRWNISSDIGNTILIIIIIIIMLSKLTFCLCYVDRNSTNLKRVDFHLLPHLNIECTGTIPLLINH